MHIYTYGGISFLSLTKVRPRESAHQLWFSATSNICMHAYALPSEARHARSEATRVVTANCT